MSAEQMRGEFEAWAKTITSVAQLRCGETYADAYLNLAWVAWQASRAAMVIALPSALNAPPYASYEGGWNDMREEATDAIEAAGGRVK